MTIPTPSCYCPQLGLFYSKNLMGKWLPYLCMTISLYAGTFYSSPGGNICLKWLTGSIAVQLFQKVIDLLMYIPYKHQNACVSFKIITKVVRMTITKIWRLLYIIWGSPSPARQNSSVLKGDTSIPKCVSCLPHHPLLNSLSSIAG